MAGWSRVGQVAIAPTLPRAPHDFADSGPLVILNGRTWCQRHANSVKWLAAKDGSIFEILNVAAIDDRSPNLAGILVDEQNDEVTAHLTSCFAVRRGVHIVTDGNIFERRRYRTGK
ncbi:MAG TPA: hypothetical protein VGU71_06370 [Candidatus Dormibacteraeota bacterium]|nr:hypothetical protein [Candidatus Dormibacteraeota bacterium]